MAARTGLTRWTGKFSKPDAEGGVTIQGSIKVPAGKKDINSADIWKVTELAVGPLTTKLAKGTKVIIDVIPDEAKLKDIKKEINSELASRDNKYFLPCSLDTGVLIDGIKNTDKFYVDINFLERTTPLRKSGKSVEELLEKLSTEFAIKNYRNLNINAAFKPSDVIREGLHGVPQEENMSMTVIELQTVIHILQKKLLASKNEQNKSSLQADIQKNLDKAAQIKIKMQDANRQIKIRTTAPPVKIRDRVFFRRIQKSYIFSSGDHLRAVLFNYSKKLLKTHGTGKNRKKTPENLGWTLFAEGLIDYFAPQNNDLEHIVFPWGTPLKLINAFSKDLAELLLGLLIFKRKVVIEPSGNDAFPIGANEEILEFIVPVSGTVPLIDSAVTVGNPSAVNEGSLTTRTVWVSSKSGDGAAPALLGDIWDEYREKRKTDKEFNIPAQKDSVIEKITNIFLTGGLPEPKSNTSLGEDTDIKLVSNPLMAWIYGVRETLNLKKEVITDEEIKSVYYYLVEIVTGTSGRGRKSFFSTYAAGKDQNANADPPANPKFESLKSSGVTSSGKQSEPSGNVPSIEEELKKLEGINADGIEIFVKSRIILEAFRAKETNASKAHTRNITSFFSKKLAEDMRGCDYTLDTLTRLVQAMDFYQFSLVTSELISSQGLAPKPKSTKERGKKRPIKFIIKSAKTTKIEIIGDKSTANDILANHGVINFRLSSN